MTVVSEPDWSRAWHLALPSRERTQQFACALAAALPQGAVIGLVGDLGAGKTTFVQGLAHGLGVADLSEVLSPTYTLVNEYPAASLVLVHIDFYRLQDEESARALGIEEQLQRADAIVVVEWANQLRQLLPPDALWLKLELTGESERTCAVILPPGMSRPAGF